MSLVVISEVKKLRIHRGRLFFLEVSFIGDSNLLRPVDMESIYWVIIFHMHRIRMGN